MHTFTSFDIFKYPEGAEDAINKREVSDHLMETIVTVIDAYTRKDLRTIREKLHRLKGTCSLFDLMLVVQTCKEIERVLDYGDGYDTVPFLLGKILIEITHINY